MDVKRFWESILAQDAERIRKYFHKSASVNWHCTNEHFSVDEFIIANCEYPGNWGGAVERTEIMGDLIVTVTRVYPIDGGTSFHVVSLIKTDKGKIVSMDEYWADDGQAPQWRLDKHIGTSIR